MKSPIDTARGKDLYRRHRGKYFVVQAILFVAIGYLMARGFSEPGVTDTPAHVPDGAVGDATSGPSLWTCSMHPEIVKDEPGACDICGMPLVRAEALGFVTSATDEKQPPLVIPYSSALVTGRRAIVYVELPVMPSGMQTAFQGIGAALDAGSVEQVRQAFSVFSNVLGDHRDRDQLLDVLVRGDAIIAALGFFKLIEESLPTRFDEWKGHLHRLGFVPANGAAGHPQLRRCRCRRSVGR